MFFLIFGMNNKNLYLDYLMIFGANYVIYLTLILIFIISLKGSISERKSLILFLFSFPILILIIKIIHLFIFEQRPFIEQDIIPLINQSADAAFPSRHTAIMTTIIFSYIKSRWFPYLLALGIWVGFARIYVGVHYPIDILGGIITGLISLVVAKQIIKFLRNKLF